ncbi:MAG TPA: TolC family protein [Gemmatimonadales bacterium]|jgi:outer membrane protein TolC|nr:TolC family protein [Gemmatimonadales bacterium]
MRWVTGIIALTIALPVQAQQAPAPQHLEVTLTEAIQRALLVQPAMVQAIGADRTAGASKRSALGAYLPSVSVNASTSKGNTGRTDLTTGQFIPPVRSYSGGISANLELFDGFRRAANLKAASATGAAADAGLVNQRFQVTLATKQAFYNGIATEDLVRVAESQVRRAQQQLQISVEKLRAGSATRSDSLRSTVDYGNARIALLQAQANLATAQATLGRQIGVDQPVRAVPDSALPELPDTAALRATPLENAPQVQQSEAQASAARAQVWTARAQYWPTLSLSYSDSRQGTKSPQVPTFGNLPDSYRWSFVVSLPLFDGFRREQSQVTASVARDNAEAVAADTRRQVNAQMTQQIAAMTTAFAKIDIARANVAAATEDLRVQNERYRVGAATILDLLTSQTALTTAEGNLVQARFDYLIARAQVEALVGRTL